MEQNERRQHALAVALDAAKLAGDFFLSRIDSIKDVKAKSSPADLVTDVDPACEHIIRTRILQSFPDHHILGEEGTEPGANASIQAVGRVIDDPHLWIVDPLDGTTNFVNGLPLSVVSVAYAERGVVYTGAIYDPYRDEMFYALRGAGAFRCSGDAAQAFVQDALLPLPGIPMNASEVKEIELSVVATGFPTRGENALSTTEAGLRIAAKVKSLRALGAAALHLAYVAAGRLDGFWEYDLNVWDLAAGVLLIEEAGGRVLEIGGAPYHLAVRDILTSGQIEVAKGIQKTLQGLL